MAVTSVGYDGVTPETTWAKHGRYQGRGAVVGSSADLAPTVGTGDRTVAIAAGDAYQHNVTAINSASLNVTLGTISSGSRWDTIVVRRNWPTNTSSIVGVAGGSTQAVSGAILAETPGSGQTDQPIALVQVTSGSSAPTAIIDMREFVSYGSARRFGSTTARDYWFTAPVEGDLAHVVGTGMTRYNGSAWVRHWGSSPPQAHGYRTGNVSFAPGVWEVMEFGTVQIDTHGLRSTARRITIPAGCAGRYAVRAGVGFASNTTGNRQVWLRKNSTGALSGGMPTGTDLDRGFGGFNTAEELHIKVAADVYLGVGDSVDVWAKQTSGTNLSVLLGEYVTYLSVRWVAAS